MEGSLADWFRFPFFSFSHFDFFYALTGSFLKVLHVWKFEKFPLSAAAFSGGF